jgi:hypothetical protein
MRDRLLGFTLDKIRRRVSDRGLGTLRLLKKSVIFLCGGRNRVGTIENDLLLPSMKRDL